MPIVLAQPGPVFPEISTAYGRLQQEMRNYELRQRDAAMRASAANQASANANQAAAISNRAAEAQGEREFNYAQLEAQHGVSESDLFQAAQEQLLQSGRLDASADIAAMRNLGRYAPDAQRAMGEVALSQLQLSSSEQQRMGHLDQALAFLNEQQAMGIPGDYAQARASIMAERSGYQLRQMHARGIQGVLQQGEAVQQAQGRTYVDEHTGLVMTIDPTNGRATPIPGQMTAEHFSQMYTNIAKSLGGDSATPPSHEAIMARMAPMLQAFDRFRRGGAQALQAQQPQNATVNASMLSEPGSLSEIVDRNSRPSQLPRIVENGQVVNRAPARAGNAESVTLGRQPESPRGAPPAERAARPDLQRLDAIAADIQNHANPNVRGNANLVARVGEVRELLRERPVSQLSAEDRRRYDELMQMIRRDLTAFNVNPDAVRVAPAMGTSSPFAQTGPLVGGQMGGFRR